MTLKRSKLQMKKFFAILLTLAMALSPGCLRRE